ncbi:MAG TPA: hypothetical protein VN516_05540, partial [Candidatus Baltobacteraceae bacterium]|nr:hypothetical protein [Candidatus Baltobacteraceae bacterium]
MQTLILNKKTLPTIRELQRLARAKALVVVYDKTLLRLPIFADWLKLSPHSFGVDAGEDLKSLDAFQNLVRQFLPMVSGQAK